MQKSFLIILALCLFTSIRCDVVEEDNVMVLTQDNFDGVLAANPYILVEFYAPWCGHCKTLAPEYAKAALALKSSEPAVPLAKVDATEHKDLGSRFGVQGFPTLKWFVNGEPSDYQGGRDENAIVAWVKKKTSPSSLEQTTVESAQALVDANRVLGFYFGESADSEQTQTFLDLTKSFDDVMFAHSFSADVRSHFGAAVGSLVLFRQFDEPQVTFSGEWTLDTLRQFVSNNSLPTIMDFDQAAAQRIFGDNVPALFLLTGENDASAAANAALTTASASLKGKIVMSSTQVADGLGKRLGDYIGVTEDQTPTVRLVNPTKEGAVLKYELDGEITAESLVQFYTSFVEGNLSPNFKSEEIPVQDKAVFTLVGKQFKEVVMDTTKDVFVEYYAPWCGHCKSLAPIYEQLAEKLRSNTNLVIAAMDATANEAEGVNIEGFPTIKFYPANNKEGVDYKGGRTLEEMETFLRENASLPFESNDEPKVNEDL